MAPSLLVLAASPGKPKSPPRSVPIARMDSPVEIPPVIPIAGMIQIDPRGRRVRMIALDERLVKINASAIALVRNYSARRSSF